MVQRGSSSSALFGYRLKLLKTNMVKPNKRRFHFIESDSDIEGTTDRPFYSSQRHTGLVTAHTR